MINISYLRNVYEFDPRTIAKMDAAGEKIAAAMKVRILIFKLQLYSISDIVPSIHHWR